MGPPRRQAVRLAPYVAAVQQALFWSGGSKRFLEARILAQWLQPTKRARGRPHAFPIGILCRQPLAISGGLSLARLLRLALSTPATDLPGDSAKGSRSEERRVGKWSRVSAER